MTEPERVLKFTARVTVIADLDLTTGGGGVRLRASMDNVHDQGP
ncbi:hypothetical protein ACFO9E_33945 [Streptomyces maoxianensis]|uniref:Uncharacterized protein n=1 Tax=Streptomyces maoxianensis TaxID=1459942 RepID=A0ABV9GHR2_9ACTN|nr:hypothetical protein [Streptomyces sp. ISL-1]